MSTLFNIALVLVLYVAYNHFCGTERKCGDCKHKVK